MEERKNMINSSTPILQIKTSGFNLQDIKTINIAINYQDGRINKGNSDIEMDQDVLIVSLTEEEADKLKRSEAGVSILAINYSNVDVSEQIKIAWVKKGSQSSSVGRYSVSEEVFNQVISDINSSIEDLGNGISISGGRIYLDYQDGKYGVNTDPDRGADTFSPFKSGTDVLENAIFIDSEYDAPSNVFSTMTQTGVYNGKVMEENPLWFEMTIVDGRIFSTEFEKINVEIEEGQNVL